LSLGAALGLDKGSEDSFKDGCSDGSEMARHLVPRLASKKRLKDGCGSGIEDCSPLGVKLSIDKGPEDGC
jgi:hypothetical protein